MPRQIQEVLVEPWLRDALIRLNPEIGAQPDFADEVLYKLRAILLSVRSDGLIRANEEMTAWMRGERSMPFGPNNEHVPVRLIDLDDLSQNHYIVTQQYTYRAGPPSAAPICAAGQRPAVGTDRGQDAVRSATAGLMVRCRCTTILKSFRTVRLQRVPVATRARPTTMDPSGCGQGLGPWHQDDDGTDVHHPLKSLKLSERACCPMWCWTSRAALLSSLRSRRKPHQNIAATAIRGGE